MQIEREGEIERESCVLQRQIDKQRETEKENENVNSERGRKRLTRKIDKKEKEINQTSKALKLYTKNDIVIQI